ncbi:MAG: hypothetical protein LBR91_03655, partial [Puniceicoccales bacterium]|nr:hypothetical protein [Puniceicoccales bacterium]
MRVGKRNVEPEQKVEPGQNVEPGREVRPQQRQDAESGHVGPVVGGHQIDNGGRSATDMRVPDPFQPTTREIDQQRPAPMTLPDVNATATALVNEISDLVTASSALDKGNEDDELSLYGLIAKQKIEEMQKQKLSLEKPILWGTLRDTLISMLTEIMNLCALEKSQVEDRIGDVLNIIRGYALSFLDETKRSTVGQLQDLCIHVGHVKANMQTIADALTSEDRLSLIALMNGIGDTDAPFGSLIACTNSETMVAGERKIGVSTSSSPAPLNNRPVQVKPVPLDVVFTCDGFDSRFLYELRSGLESHLNKVDISLKEASRSNTRKENVNNSQFFASYEEYLMEEVSHLYNFLSKPAYDAITRRLKTKDKKYCDWHFRFVQVSHSIRDSIGSNDKKIDLNFVAEQVSG